VFCSSILLLVPVGNYPEGLAYDSAKHEIFETDSGSFATPTMRVISDSTNNVSATMLIGDGGTIAYDSGKGEIFVTDGLENNSIAVISDSNKYRYCVNSYWEHTEKFSLRFCYG
jgi:DNA-binding beta-propeller fold protein YncE